MRAFEAAPMACVIAALGLAELLRMLWPDATRQRRIVAWGASVALAMALALNVWVYFVIMPPNPEVFLGFYPVQSQMGTYVRDAAGAPGGGRIYVPRTVVADEVFAFLSAGLPVETFEGAMLSAPPQPGDRFLISGYFAEQEVAALAPFLGANPQPLAAGPGFPDGRGPTFFVYQIPVAP
jgi:hypothetical protein